MRMQASVSAGWRLAGLCIAAALLVSAADAGISYAAESRITGDSSALLDGTRFLTQDEFTNKKDTLVFSGGKFVAESCKAFGFAESPYWVRTEGDKVHFLAETASPTHGTMLWKGTVSGDQVDATYLWTRERWYWTIRREYRLRGARAK